MQAQSFLTDVLNEIRQAEVKYQRARHSVSLLAASKGQSSEKIRNLYQQGQMVFGENYLQEALEKIAQLKDCNIEWHFIGPIQSNKTKKIAEHFSWVQSIENKKIAERLNRERPPTLSKLNVCIEVNIDNEAAKHGVIKEDIFSLLDNIMHFPNLTLRGLMAIPKESNDFAEECLSFRKMYELFCECKRYLENNHDKKASELFDTLSIGMSQDFKAAIKEGATMVRIGRALFGGR